MDQNLDQTQKVEQDANQKLENQPEATEANRNVSTLQPVDNEELAENLSGADSSLEKPKDQDA
jgi:hypothetical protein